MATRTTLDPNFTTTYPYYGANIPSENARPSESVPVNLPSVGASPSLPALPSSSSLSTQPSLVEQAINKALKNPCIFFGLDCDKEFDFLHPDYPVSFEYKGLKYACATAAIEAQKFTNNPESMKKFEKVKAYDVFDVSYSIWFSAPKLSDEQRKKIEFETQLAKFSQNSDLLQRLLLTADAYLASHSIVWASDTPSLWTDGHDGTGTNQSGQILMRIRKELGGIGIVKQPDNFKALVKELEASKF